MITPIAFWNNPSSIDANTLLLLHFNGTQSSTTTVDSSNYNRSIVSINNGQITTTFSKFGVGSENSYGGVNTRAFSVTASSDWNIGTQSFTIDCWLMTNSVSPVGNCEIVTHATNDNARANLMLIAGGNLYCQSYSSTDVSLRVDISATMSWSAGVWKHVAIVRNYTTGTASDWMLFEDGVSKTKILSAGSYSNSPYFSATQPLDIGPSPRTTYVVTNNGFFIDEVRITRGALWLSNFTPPTSQME